MLGLCGWQWRCKSIYVGAEVSTFHCETNVLDFGNAKIIYFFLILMLFLRCHTQLKDFISFTNMFSLRVGVNFFFILQLYFWKALKFKKEVFMHCTHYNSFINPYLYTDINNEWVAQARHQHIQPCVLLQILTKV